MTLRTRAILLITATVLGGTALFAFASASVLRGTYEALTGPAVATRQDDLLSALETRLHTMGLRAETLENNSAADYLEDREAGIVDRDHRFLRRLDEDNTRRAGLDALVVIDRHGLITDQTVPGGVAQPGGPATEGQVPADLLRQLPSVFVGDDVWGGLVVHGGTVGLLVMAPVRGPASNASVGTIALYDAIDGDLRLPDLRDGLDGVRWRTLAADTIGEDALATISSPLEVERGSDSGTMTFRSDGLRMSVLEVEVDTPAALTTLHERTLRDLTIRVVVFGLGIGVVLLIWFERRLLSRLSRLSELVGAATARRDERAPVELTGRDELSDLAVSIEETLASLEEARDDLADANAGLRAADHAKNSFISVVSHELRTPLTAILGFTETLRTHWDALDRDRAHEFLGRMSRQAAALDRMVDDLLVLSRMQSGSIRYEPETLRLTEFLDATVRAMPNGAGVEVDVEDVHVTADPDHLRRIVVNFVDNAVKYGRPPVRVSSTRVGDTLALRVIDHGEGVPDSFLPELFERFTQADSGDTRTSSGVGLGLSIVRQLAEQNGGRAWYERYDGRPCFVVSLPVAAVTRRQLPLSRV